MCKPRIEGAEVLRALPEIRRLLRYDAATGRFHWAVARRGHAKAGDLAGRLHANGYRSIKVLGRAYLAHRLAWAFVHGQWPQEEIDHMNGDRDDNRIENLRPADRKTNGQNIRAPHIDGTSGLLGVTYSKARRKWQAQIKANGRVHWIGRFEEKHQAHAAYLAAKRELHQGNTL